tara:strand:- start:68 stop:223 length:156 start_codon:yes stop_codon:yes gene_type:complete
MNTETMKAMGGMIKSLSEFVDRQTAMNETLMKAVVVLQNQVKELTEREDKE